MITVSKKMFLDGISGAATVAKGSLAFDAIRVKQDGDVLSFTATNGERTFTKSITVAPSIEPIDVLVPVKIEQLVKDLTADVVNFEFGDGKVKITTAKNKAELKTKSSDTFPAFPAVPDDATSVVLRLAELQKAFRSVAYAAATDAVRFAFRGVNMYADSDTNEVEFCATNSHLLAQYSIKATVTGVKRSIVIPPQTVQMITSIESDENQSVTLLFDGSKIYIETETTKAHSSLIDAKFPEYKRVIPATSTVVATLEAVELVAGIKQCGSFIDKSSGRATLSFNGTIARIIAKDPEMGNIATEIPLVTPVASAFEIDVNTHYLTAICAAISEKNITLGMTDANKPAKISFDTESAFLAVVMPLIAVDTAKSA